MKKLFVPIVALATVFMFTSCGSDIKFTIPDGDITIDLGDRTKALEGVSAKGKKDIPKEDIKIEGLDWVGKGKLTYTAKDEDGKTETATRDVTVKADKLFGTYAVQYYFGETKVEGVVSTNVSSSSDNTRLVVNTFFGKATWSAVFAGDGKSMKLTMDKKTFSLPDPGDPTKTLTCEATGTAEYAIGTKGYSIVSLKFTAVWDDGEIENFTATFEKN